MLIVSSHEGTRGTADAGTALSFALIFPLMMPHNNGLLTLRTLRQLTSFFFFCAQFLSGRRQRRFTASSKPTVSPGVGVLQVWIRLLTATGTE